LPYVNHVKDGFDAGTWYEFPFQETRVADIRDRLINRRVLQGPKRYPYRDSLPEPPPDIGGRIIPCVYPNWDNTPRAGRRGVLAVGSSPQRFAAHLRRALELARSAPIDEQIVLIKSWNEWAEGNYLEPDSEYGLARLEAVAAEVRRSESLTPTPVVPSPASSALSPTEQPSI
jgi:hypothetical protein